MGRITWVPALMVATGLSGCAALTTVAAIPGALVEGAVRLVVPQEEGLTADLSRTLAAVQKGLRRMDLDVDILEPERDGYRIAFANDRLDGDIRLKRQTPKLTTIAVRVRHGALREKAVEKAIMKTVRELATGRRARGRFDFHGYRNIRRKPEIKAERVGWYRRGARLEARKSRRKGWLRVRLPSGRWGYFKGRLPAPEKRRKRARKS